MYAGRLPDGTPVAVKRLDRHGLQARGHGQHAPAFVLKCILCAGLLFTGLPLPSMVERKGLQKSRDKLAWKTWKRS